MVPVELMSCQTGNPDNLKRYEQAGEWIMEEKFDGERIQAIREGEGEPVRLFGRSKKEFTHAAPEIVAALEKSRASSFHFDGEIVHIDPNLSGEECFALTSSRMRMKKPSDSDIVAIPLKYVMFDMIGKGNFIERRGKLKAASPKDTGISIEPTLSKIPILLSYWKHANLQTWYSTLLSAGKEGAILKKIDAQYQNKRSKDWLKIIPVITEDVIATGLIPGKGKFEPYFGAVRCLAPNGKEFNAGPGRLGFAQMLAIKNEIESGTLEFPFVIEILLKGWQPSGIPRMPRTNRIRYDKLPSECRKEDVVQKTLFDF